MPAHRLRITSGASGRAIEIHHPVMRLVAGIAWDLKKLQKLYIDDLTKELHRRYDCK